MTSERASERAFFSVSALLFGASAAVVRGHVGDGRDGDARRLDDVSSLSPPVETPTSPAINPQFDNEAGGTKQTGNRLDI